MPMNARQLAVAAAADTKWLMNSATILRRRLRYSIAEARWWGLVRLLTEALALPLTAAARAATTAFGAGSNHLITIGADPTDSAALQIDLDRYGSIFLANLSRALIHETPKRRGRPSRPAKGNDAITRARNYGVDLGLVRAALDRTPAERLAMLEANARFVRVMRRNGK
jgi:hypothetical protein